MEPLLGALLVFGLRICDVSIGTLRVLYTVRGRRMIAAGLGAVEAGIFIFAITRVLADMDPARMVGYALGFATGTALGMTLERWIASGFILARVISPKRAAEILEALRGHNFGVTVVRGEGRQGELLILFVVARRRRGKLLINTIQDIDRSAFLTIDPVTTAIGGYIQHVPSPATVRK